MAIDRSSHTTIDLPFIAPPSSALTPEDLLILQSLLTRGAWHPIDVMRAIDLTAAHVCDEMSCCQFLVVSIASSEWPLAANKLNHSNAGPQSQLGWSSN